MLGYLGFRTKNAGAFGNPLHFVALQENCGGPYSIAYPNSHFALGCGLSRLSNAIRSVGLQLPKADVPARGVGAPGLLSELQALHCDSWYFIRFGIHPSICIFRCSIVMPDPQQPKKTSFNAAGLGFRVLVF